MQVRHEARAQAPETELPEAAYTSDDVSLIEGLHHMVTHHGRYGRLVRGQIARSGARAAGGSRVS